MDRHYLTYLDVYFIVASTMHIRRNPTGELFQAEEFFSAKKKGHKKGNFLPTILPRKRLILVEISLRIMSINAKEHLVTSFILFHLPLHLFRMQKNFLSIIIKVCDE